MLKPWTNTPRLDDDPNYEFHCDIAYLREDEKLSDEQIAARLNTSVELVERYAYWPLP